MQSPLLAGAYPTPFGDLFVLVEPASGAIVRSSLRPISEALLTLDPALASAGWVERPDARVRAALEAWAVGDGSLLTEVPVLQSGTELQQEIWEAVRAIPSGETATYGEIALDVGRPRGARAVGAACSRNLTTPFTPCHRVVAAHGLGGFGGSDDLKRRMIQLEAR